MLQEFRKYFKSVFCENDKMFCVDRKNQNLECFELQKWMLMLVDPRRVDVGV